MTPINFFGIYNPMLNMVSSSFRKLYPHLDTDEKKAEKFLDDWYSSGGSPVAMSRNLELSRNTVTSILAQIQNDNKEFYSTYLDVMEGRVKDFRSAELGQNLYAHYMNEVEQCEENYQKYMDDGQDREARLWKAQKHKLMDTLLKIHVDVTKAKNGNEKPKNDRDSRLSREAKRLQ